jgi:hypothetical protein
MEILILDDTGKAFRKCKLFDYSSVEISDDAKAAFEFAERFNLRIEITDLSCIEILETMSLGYLHFDELMLSTGFQKDFEFQNNLRVEFDNRHLFIGATGRVVIQGEDKEYTATIQKTSNESIVEFQKILMGLHNENVKSYEESLIEPRFDRHSEAFQIGH